jgi:hypothetical protein
MLSTLAGSEKAMRAKVVHICKTRSKGAGLRIDLKRRAPRFVRAGPTNATILMQDALL